MRNRDHAGLFEYLMRNGLSNDIQRDEAGIALIFDHQYRVRCWWATNRDVVFESHITELPEDTEKSDALLHEALECAASRLYTHEEALVISEDTLKLTLQMRIAEDATVDDVECALEKFLNSIAGWRQRFFLS